MCGGRLAYRQRSRWIKRPWFKDLYDIDSDGRPDFVLSSRQRRNFSGFVHVEIKGKESLKLSVIQSYPSAHGPDQIRFQKELSSQQFMQ